MVIFIHPLSNDVKLSRPLQPTPRGAKTMPGSSKESTKPAKTIDCIGLYCPEPVYRTSQEISSVAVGEILEVLADDPASESDITSWAKHSGNELISVEKTKAGFRFLIRRTA